MAGWVSNDEACVNYMQAVNQLTEGHRWLEENVFRGESRRGPSLPYVLITSLLMHPPFVQAIITAAIPLLGWAGKSIRLDLAKEWRRCLRRVALKRTRGGAYQSRRRRT